MSIDLGDEQVLVERIDSTEALSTPFHMLLDIIAPLEIDIHPHLGKPARVKVVDEGRVQRHFHGFVTAAEYCKESLSGHHYRLTLRPWTYFLDQNRDFAIYQEIDAVAIIKKVLEEAGVSDTDFTKLSKTRGKRTYCVQYGESDFAFISRLMEEEGIYYFFRHDGDRHVMVLCESPNAHTAGKPAKLYFNPASSTIVTADASSRGDTTSDLQSFVERVSTTAGAKVTMRDYDFEKPDRPLNAVSTELQKHPRDTQEIYAYPGLYVEERRGGELGQVMLDATRATRRVLTGKSQALGITCGARLSVENHPVDRLNASYVVISARHRFVSERYRAITAQEAEAEQKEGVPDEGVEFEAIPADTRFHAPRTTRKPVVQGLESAVITGPEGEKIYTDKYGRVKVRFHWDRHGRPGDQTTCWMRVSQTGGLGNLILPRIGHEVLVDFLNGDPDRPLVVGRVFNKTHMPIYELPENKTRALWRTLTYGDPGDYPDTKELDVPKKNVNEIRFEDKGGKEEIWIQAQRDMNVRVHFDDSHHVGHDQNHYVGHDRTAEVINDETTKIGNDQTLTVVGNQTNTIEKERRTEVKQNDTVQVNKNRKLKAEQNIVYEAGMSIELKVGPVSIKIDHTGITMKGPMVKVTGDTMVEVQAPMTQVKGSAMVIIKGGLTMIN
ncbi:type VI secretion system Vgr family protein [Sphingomonas sp.]|uniref:type VI secretion system Vgr family protein n=1 Tax=Sphingomonas sp. TaxID=28214 RepID=UPI002DD685AD|nr:type VI secretion system tip protein TssI/VgrG [Sphingomonas sp.]